MLAFSGCIAIPINQLVTIPLGIKVNLKKFSWLAIAATLIPGSVQNHVGQGL